jgi:ribonuclease E
MKIKLAGILGLAVLIASFSCGSLVYADALEATSSAMQALAPDANANGTESVDALPCASYDDDGAETCTVNATLAVADQPSSPAGAIEPSATEAASTEAASTEVSAAPAIQSVDAIIVEVTQTVTIAAPGQDTEGEAAALAGSTPESPATEPVLVIARATIDPSLLPAIAAVDAVEAAQTATIAVPSEDGDSAETAPTGSIPEPAATESIAVIGAEATAEESPAPAIEAVDAVAVEAVQTATVAVPGQDAGDCDGPAYTGSIPQPPIAEPVSTLDANSADDVE